MELWSHLGEGVLETSRPKSNQDANQDQEPVCHLSLTKKRVDHIQVKRGVLELKSWGRKEEGCMQTRSRGKSNLLSSDELQRAERAKRERQRQNRVEAESSSDFRQAPSYTQ
ncbi:unnamed protein product [Microthlaspi erraticum]|uniref:Uncharacterized protein n=1 Tax=Microthlaspi erraticum TaxID=1685480 RepID=A0A6D2JTB9_9BRAS|nr:unnamed protein product [Microthlaspi erraticum]